MFQNCCFVAEVVHAAENGLLSEKALSLQQFLPLLCFC